MESKIDIKSNVERVNERIAHAAARAGRDTAGITLVAVSKTVSADRVEEAYAAGIRHFGENRAQELTRKCSVLDLDCTWHFIGHLQSNKVKEALAYASLIHSVDNLPLAVEIDRRAAARGVAADMLAQINISDEDTKSGIQPEEARGFVMALSALPNLRVLGLMAIARPTDNPEEARPEFRRMKEIFDELSTGVVKTNVVMKYLSMGMSHDFEVAVEEGANIVRVGSAIFGSRLP